MDFCEQTWMQDDLSRQYGNSHSSATEHIGRICTAFCSPIGAAQTLSKRRADVSAAFAT